MKQAPANQQNTGLNVDMVAWRVLNAKRREAQVTRNKAYNERPRLRSEAHH